MSARRLDPAQSVGSDPQKLIQAFASEIGAIRAAPQPVKPRAVMFLLCGLFVSLLAVAAYFDLDRVVTSQQAQVVTVDPNTALQALDESIIKTINVEEGQIVRAGALLETLDPTFTAADTQSLKDQIASLDAQIARCEAELSGAPLSFPGASDSLALKYQTLQSAFYAQRKQQFESQVAAFDAQMGASRATIAKYREDETHITLRNGIAGKVQKIWDGLQVLDSATQLQSLGANDTKQQMEQALAMDEGSIAEAQHQFDAITAGREAFIQQWRAATSQELLTARTTRDMAAEALNKARRHGELVRIEAPADSIVLNIPKMSVGSVVIPGAPLMTLAQLNVPVEVEVAIAPRDVGFVRIGDKATIKLDPFDFVEHGVASGVVRWISEGTFTTDLISGIAFRGAGMPVDPYYKARIHIDSVELRDVPKDFRLLPGATGTVDIRVGSRSALLYFLKGLIKTLSESMREAQ